MNKTFLNHCQNFLSHNSLEPQIREQKHSMYQMTSPYNKIWTKQYQHQQYQCQIFVITKQYEYHYQNFYHHFQSFIIIHIPQSNKTNKTRIFNTSSKFSSPYTYHKQTKQIRPHQLNKINMHAWKKKPKNIREQNPNKANQQFLNRNKQRKTQIHKLIQN